VSLRYRRRLALNVSSQRVAAVILILALVRADGSVVVHGGQERVGLVRSTIDGGAAAES
jgi:hypothetical protein